MKSHKKMKILAAILMLGLLCGTAFAVPNVLESNPDDSETITKNVGETQEFNVTLTEEGNVTWYVDGDEKETDSGTFKAVYEYTVKLSEEVIKAVVNRSPEDDVFIQWTIVGEEKEDLEITDFYPDKGEDNWEEEDDGDLIKTVTESSSNSTFDFNITVNQNCTIEWFVDGNSVDEVTDVTYSEYDEFEAGEEIDEYTITATATSDEGDSVSQSWIVDVVRKGYYSGNRIWEEGMSTTYTWDALSYSGFFYDLDDGEYSETLTITGIDDSINEEAIEYSTEPMETDFEYNNWGSYQVIGFMAEKYFAGYNENTTIEGESLDESLIKEGVLAKVLTDTDDKESAYSGSSFILEDGYALNIVEVDVNGDTVWIQLEKDGDVVDDDFLSSNDDYVYEADLGDADDVPIIIAHIGTVFAGQETSAVFIEGIFQISDNYVEIEEGDSFGEMEIKTASSSGITMKNEDDVSLDAGDTIELMGKILIQVADDDDTLRFAPYVDISEPGTYELRGTVYDAEDDDPILTWDPYNFEGFYYNIDEGIGTEELRIEELSGREIPDNKLVYESNPQPVEFEHDQWGYFQVIGFMAEKYFAGYIDEGDEKTTVGDEDLDVSLLSDNILCKVLTDTDDKESMYSGSALILEEGYALNIQEVDINGEVVWVQLEKDGDAVDDAFVESNEDYVYETELGDAEDIPLIIVHFSNVFAGAETNAVFVEGIFQISDDYLEIESDDNFGEMEVSSIGESGITMKNDDDINLDEDETIEIMGEVNFKTADDSTVRFYPFVEIETDGGASRELRIDVPDEIIEGEEFTIEVTAGEDEVEDVTVKVDGKTVGKTDEDGEVTYSDDAGTYKVTAEKDGYTTANTNIEIIEPKIQMTVSVSPKTVYVGDTMTIEVLEAIGGDPVEDAEIAIDGEFLEETDEDGTVTYSTDEPGTIKVSATKKGYLDESTNVKVRELEAIFVYSNLVIDPLEVRAEKEATISVDVENTGNAAGDTNVELVVNGTVAGSQTISLGIGEGTTVTFKHAEEVPGTYTAKVGGETGTYTVLEKSSGLLYGLGALILAIAGGAAYMFTKGGWTVAMVQEKVQELLDSVKPRK
ncbi:S-layer family duplication domain protein [Methanosarcina sp. MTP4]|uniref:S-layer protein domain-containing protein n=1 Tax=Methanosarcina sp. MTP4 TaxID=1434100 RepID=UPI000615F63A|nr:S-layer protein domain-containing protein [Methanosarcina sp. MTP4]AKB26662.1 S-layer family duplication domain protein [Methanosarcina sp. MTP4]